MATTRTHMLRHQVERLLCECGTADFLQHKSQMAWAKARHVSLPECGPVSKGLSEALTQQ